MKFVTKYRAEWISALGDLKNKFTLSMIFFQNENQEKN